MVTKSLATDRTYVLLQGRVRKGVLHIQGSGTEVNRPYGVADNITIGLSTKDWLEKLPEDLVSLAGTGMKYFPVQAVINDGRIHVQVKGSPGCNRGYGLAFDVKIDAHTQLAKFIDLELATAAKLIPVVEKAEVEIKCN